MENRSMKAPKLSLGKIILVLVLGIATWKALPVIDYFTGKTIHWKQEAPLHDGRMLIVERANQSPDVSLLTITFNT
jgi:hypothetical protein